MRLKIVGGTIVTPAGRIAADVACRDGRVVALAEPGSAGPADEAVDARGLLVFPGFIDPHVHSRDPGMTEKEDFAHATRAAAAGGVTTVLEMPNAVPPVADAAVFRERAAHHARSAFVDFGLWGLALPPENLGEVAGLFAAGAVGVKLFWGYALDRRSKALIYNPGDRPAEDVIPPPDNRHVFDLFREVARCGGLLAAHCEDRGLLESAQAALGHGPETYGDLLAARPDAAEAASVALAAEFARASGCRFHVVHASSARGVAIVRRAQAEGIAVSAETCPHYLTLTDEDCAALGPVMKVYPPVRRAADRDALWEAVRDGVIASVGSDHAPHTTEQKRGALAVQPAGCAGVETLAPVMIDAMARGQLTPERLAWVLSEGTARLYGLHPRKGALLPGADADLTLVDPEGETAVDNARLHSKHPLSPWHGRRLRGALRLAVLRGEAVMRDGEPVGPARGRLVRPVRLEEP
jgi:allantoinase